MQSNAFSKWRAADILLLNVVFLDLAIPGVGRVASIDQNLRGLVTWLRVAA
jgi:hypothetical protein